MHVHFVAVAGTGMGALAGLFKSAGHDVSGSDVVFYPPMGPVLERWGIRLMTGFSDENLDDPRPDLVIVGNVCRPWNPEAVAAQERGIPMTSMAHALADHVLTGTSPLVVGGTHGKTTTSAMCAWLLHEAGRVALDAHERRHGRPANTSARNCKWTADTRLRSGRPMPRSIAPTGPSSGTG